MKPEIQHHIETELRGISILRTTRRAVEIGFVSVRNYSTSPSRQHIQLWLPRRLIVVEHQNSNGSFDLKVSGWFWARALKRLGII